MRTVEAPFTVVFECSGHAAAAESALDQLDYAGTFVFVGTGNTPPRVNHNRVIVLEQTLIGAYNYDAAGFRPASRCRLSAIAAGPGCGITIEWVIRAAQQIDIMYRT